MQRRHPHADKNRAYKGTPGNPWAKKRKARRYVEVSWSLFLISIHRSDEFKAASRCFQELISARFEPLPFSNTLAAPVILFRIFCGRYSKSNREGFRRSSLCAHAEIPGASSVSAPSAWMRIKNIYEDADQQCCAGKDCHHAHRSFLFPRPAEDHVRNGSTTHPFARRRLSFHQARKCGASHGDHHNSVSSEPYPESRSCADRRDPPLHRNRMQLPFPITNAVTNIASRNPRQAQSRRPG